jgi:hypothetical protein
LFYTLKIFVFKKKKIKLNLMSLYLKRIIVTIRIL